MAASDLSDIEGQIFQSIEKLDIVRLRAVLSIHPNVNIFDENLMTPLQHAAYKGNLEIVQLLLDQGADVNLCKHVHNYTTLHFAALSGKAEVCTALLLAGANTEATNTVNRTPAQMAAFVSHHNCVAVINHFIPRSFVDAYTIPCNPEEEPLLSPFHAERLHKLIIQPSSLHPVRVVINMHDLHLIGDNMGNMQKVLEFLCNSQMKADLENELISLKCYYYGFIIRELIAVGRKMVSGIPEIKQKSMEPESGGVKVDIVELFARKMLKPSKKDPVILENIESLVRECVIQYPFKDNSFLRQIYVALLGDTKNKYPREWYKDLDASLLYILQSSITGRRCAALDPSSNGVCSTCGNENPLKKCSKCKLVQYCDRYCQKLHWHWHKKSCQKLGQLTLANDSSAFTQSSWGNVTPEHVDMDDITHNLKDSLSM